MKKISLKKYYIYFFDYRTIIIGIVLTLASLITCFFMTGRKSRIGEVCLKDFLIDYSFKIAPYIIFPLITLVILIYVRKIFNTNIVVRYINIRAFYADIIIGVVTGTIIVLFLTLLIISLGGIIFCDFRIDNWECQEAYSRIVYDVKLVDTHVLKLMAVIFISWVLIAFINFEICLIIHRFTGNLYLGYILSVMLDIYCLLETANTQISRFYVKYFVYVEGWKVDSLLFPVIVASVLLIIIMFMGRADFVKRR